MRRNREKQQQSTQEYIFILFVQRRRQRFFMYLAKDECWRRNIYIFIEIRRCCCCFWFFPLLFIQKFKSICAGFLAFSWGLYVVLWKLDYSPSIRFSDSLNLSNVFFLLGAVVIKALFFQIFTSTWTKSRDYAWVLWLSNTLAHPPTLPLFLSFSLFIFQSSSTHPFTLLSFFLYLLVPLTPRVRLNIMMFHSANPLSENCPIRMKKKKP